MFKNMKANINKIGFGLSMASILGSIYAYTIDENLGIFYWIVGFCNHDRL